MSKNNPYSPYFYKNYTESKRQQTDKTAERVDDSDKTTVKLRKKQPRLHKKDKRGAIALLLIMICFFSTVLCADYFTSGLVLAAFEPKTISTDKKAYYAVRLGYFNDKKTADKYSDDISARAAAGYVRRDEYYNVIAAVYKDRDRAEKVVDRMIKNNMAATITVIEIKPLNSEFLSNSMKKTCETALNVFDEVYDALFDISNELDKNRLTEAEAMKKIESVASDVENKKNIFDTATVNYAHPAVSRISSAMTVIIKRLEETGKTDYVYLSSPVRYAYTAIVYDYYDLSDELAKLK